MSTSSSPINAMGPTAGEPTLFDSLACLVPEDLQKQYYRVLAHTHSLGPDDEMLRILEAMGTLALLTRHTPRDIAEERVRIQELLDHHLQFLDESQRKMLGYTRELDKRLSCLPSEVEAGLNPQQLAKLLGEGLRQHFVQSGVPETVAALQAAASAMAGAQQKLTRALLELSDHHGGIVAQVRSANSQLLDSLEYRARKLESLVHEFKSDLLRIWMPIVVGAAMLIGLLAGMGLQAHRDSATTAESNQASPTIIQSAPEIPSEGTATQSRTNQQGHSYTKQNKGD